MNLKKLVASLVLLTQATNAFAIGQAGTQVLADKIKSVTGSGTINVNTANTWTIPNATDTAVGKATTDVLTNKSLSTGGTNTVGATTISGVTGSGSLVFGTTPTIGTPAITGGTISGASMTGTTTFPGTSSVDGSGNAIFGGTGNIAGATLIGGAGSANAKSILELASTTLGFLPPRMTTTQKNAITSPTTGLVVYDTDLKSIQVYNGTSWVTAGSGGLSYAADTGAANAYVIAPTPAALAYNTGDTYIFKATNANTTSSTLNVSALGVKNIKTPQVANLPANAILANAIVMVVYDGTQFQIINAQDPTIVSPLTTKGDVATFSTIPARIAVPGDYGRLLPDSAATTGWRAASYTQFQNGAPTKNYIQYADFENNATTGWTATGCATVTNGLCASVGSGGTAFSSANGGRAKGANTSSPAIDSSSNVSGTYSLNLATTAAGTIGDGYISSLYAIDPSDRGKVLSWKLNYKVASGTPVMQGTSTNTYAALIYDPVNNSWLGTTGAFNFVQSSGVGVASGTVQTLSTTTSVQIFVYSPVAPTGASSLLVDDFYVGPQTLNYSAAMGDWIAFTPTGSWVANTTYTGFYRRKGDSIDLQYQISLAGAPTAATLTLNTPSGITLDTAKLTAQAANAIFGGVKGLSGGNGFAGAVQYNTTTSLIPVYTKDGATASIMTYGAITQLAPYTFAASDFITVTATDLPVVGWSSNSVQSADSDTKVIAAEMQYSGTAAMTNNVLVPWDAPIYDTTGSYNTGSGAYVVPVTGKYKISCGFNTSSTAALALGNVFTLRVYVNTVADKYCATVYAQTTTAHPKNGAGAVTLNLKAGDSIEIRSVVSAVNGHTFSGDVGLNYFMIERVSGPAVTAASEKIYAFYTGNAGTVLTANTTNVDWSTKVQNSHGTGVFDGTTFTAPRPVFCQFSGSFFTTAGVTATFSYYVNATIKQALGGGTSARTFPFSFGYYLNQGDTLTFRTDTGATLSNSATLHWISVLCP